MNNYSYVTLLTNDSYISGVVLLKEGLNRVKSKYPLLCLVTDSVSESSIGILDSLGVSHRKIDRIPTPDNIMRNNLRINPEQANIWKDVLTKFQIFNLEGFDKIIFLDADLLIWKNIDHCFEMSHMAAAVDGEYVNLWPSYTHFNAGFMVIKPDKKIFEDLVSFTKNLDVDKTLDFAGRNYIIADQEILNLYYKDWPNQKEKHLSKYYNMFPVHIPPNCTKDLLENGYFFHFVGMKPWTIMGPANFPFIKENMSLLALDLKENTRCSLFYELAYNIIDLSFKNNFKVNWEEIEANGVFDENLAKLCLSFFKDFDTAVEYAEKALSKNPDNSNLLQLKQVTRVYKKISHVKPLVLEVLKEVQEDFEESGIPTLDLFHSILALSKVKIDTTDSLVITQIYWDIIKEAVEKYVKDIYNNKEWEKLIYN